MRTRPPGRRVVKPGARRRAGPLRLRLATPRRRWLTATVAVLGLLALLAATGLTLAWVHHARLIDARLSGEERPMPRIFGRPFDLRPGQGLSPAQFVERLNDVGYSQLDEAGSPGEFAVDGLSVSVLPRTVPPRVTGPIRVEFSRGAAPAVLRVTDAAGRRVDRLALEAPLVAALVPGQRRRYTPLERMPQRIVDAVLAIEDRRFFQHPGVDPIRMAGALVTNLRGNRPYLEGGSTLTQQIVKNTFLTPAKTPTRKLREQFMALVVESRLTKEQILELYLNDVVLGQRGPFEIRGVAEAARIFFGKHIGNVTLAEAATIAGVIQAPSSLSPFRNPDRARERRNLVLREMADAGFVPADDARAAAEEPLVVSTRALENEAPYFVDYVSQLVDSRASGLLRGGGAVDVHTSLDLHLQRLAQEAIETGLAQIDKQLAARRRTGRAQAALVAVDPATGDVLAFVGGRAYSQTQFNRASGARRQPGSVFKPFVYLAAFERMADEGRADITPASVVIDEPTIFMDGDKEYAPANYQNEYDGPVTVRRALARSRNVAAIKVAEAAGYEQVAEIWRRVGVGTPARPYPSIALGVFEASPLEIAEAYTLFLNGGSVRPLRPVTGIVEGGRARPLPPAPLRPVARPETTFLVTNLLRAVMNEGTGAGARSAGFTLDAAGKTGTTNDLRDAWFVGFTPELLTVVWVGFDDNQPIGLGGAQAALPIWTGFMRRALSAQPDRPFEVPPGVEFAEIDRETGQLATFLCPQRLTEAFVEGTVPGEFCHVHGSSLDRLLSRVGRSLGRIIR